MRFPLRLANRKFLLPLLGVFVLALLFFPQNAHAFVWWPVIGGALIANYLFGSPNLSAAAQPLFDVLSGLINVFLGTIAFLLQGIYIAMGQMLFGILKYFMSVPVMDTAFVFEAWNFSRSLVNGLFLLILAFIGLATILRLQSYQLQRTLPLLIIAALLVNFSGVLVEVAVDMGNILTASFLNPSEHFTWEWNPWSGTAPYQTTEKMGQNIARIFFFLFGVLIYFVILFIFGFRIIVLWTIAILAPIAFAAIALPATRRWWQQWLSTLIQWAFIGVPIAFFMYLAGNAMNVNYKGAGGIDNVITAAFAPASALLLLLVGIGVSLSLAPAWGRRLALLGAAGGVAAGVGLGYLGLRRYGRGTQQFFENLRQRGQGVPIRDEDKTKLERGLERVGSLPGFKQVGGALAGWGKRTVTRTVEHPEHVTTDEFGERTIPGYTEDIEETRRTGLPARLFGAGGKLVAGTAGLVEGATSRLTTLANKSAEEQIRRAMTEAQRLRPQDNAVRIREALLRPTRESSMTALAHYLKMVVDDDPSDIEGLVKTGALSETHLKKIATAAKQLKNPNHYRTFLKSQISRINDFEPSWGEEDVNRFIHRFVRLEDISGLNIDWHQYDPTDDQKRRTLDRLMLQMGRNPLPAMLQAVSDPAARERIMDHLESHDDDWYINNRKENILLWSTSNAALDQFGLTPIRGYTRAQAQRIVREGRLKNRSVESLQQERDNIHQELTIDQGPQQRRSLTRQAARIEAELEIRKRDATGSGSLEEEASMLDSALRQIKAVPQNQRSVDWHKDQAEIQARLREIQAEQNRRQREAPSGPEAVRGIRVPPITEPVGEQIANREARLREIDEVLVRPGPVPDRAERRKERNTLTKELRQLRTRRDQLPPELLQREQKLETLQREYMTKRVAARKLQEKVEQERAMGVTEPEIASAEDAVRRANLDLQNLERQRDAARQERTQAIAEARGWRYPEWKYAEQLSALQAHEWELTRQLRQQEATAAPMDAVRRTEGLLNRIVQNREVAERKLAAVLRGQQIASRLTRANETQQRITREVEEAQRRLQTATEEPAQLLQNRINSLQEQLRRATNRTSSLAEEENRLKRMEGDWTLASTDPSKATGLADEDPNNLTDEQKQERATYLKNIEKVKHSPAISAQMERLRKQHEDVEREIHREGRRREQGI